MDLRVALALLGLLCVLKTTKKTFSRQKATGILMEIILNQYHALGNKVVFTISTLPNP